MTNNNMRAKTLQLHRVVNQLFPFAVLALIPASAFSQNAVAPSDVAERRDPTATVAQWKHAARRGFAEGDLAGAREHLKKLLALHREQRGDDSYEWCRRLAEVAQEYLRVGELNEALAILGEAADFNLPFDEQTDDGLGNAAAGWHRRLIVLDAGERFELLHRWSMPTQSRRTVRVLTSITPTDTTPPVFARAIGERPRHDSFAVPEVGEVRGLFCTAWELVTAADEAGTLRRLTSELSQLAGADLPNADLALTLARIVGSRREDDALLDELKEHATALPSQAGGSRFATLPLAQRVWQFGYGRYDDDSEGTVTFHPLRHWDGTRWRGGVAYPDEVMGWINLRATGGHPGRTEAAIRRWIAPAAGTLAVTGALRRDGPAGNGVRGRLVSSRAGLVAQWVVQTGTLATRSDAIGIERGDTIDFVVDAIDDDATMDTFSWTTRLDLATKDGKPLAFDSATGFHGPAESSADVIVAAACLTQDWLRPIGGSILNTKLEQTYDSESPRMRAFLRYAHATAIQKRLEDAADPFTGEKLAMWLPSSTKRAWPSWQGSVRSAWLSHQGHIMHAFGPRNDYLLFKYPLTGDFEFSCETQIGGSGGTDGCVAYGGLGYEVLAANELARIWDSSFQKLTELPCPFVASSTIPTFNRFSLKSSERGVIFSANGHPNWTDTLPRGTSPWIGLRSWGDCVPIFRNFQITGSPVIPREVTMSAGDSLRGWGTDYYDESTPRPATVDWSANGGTIHGAKRPAVNGVVSQSRMYYLRPLQNGESISYEFEYKPDELEVHPSLGRIAFLIEPDGVRLHWMTDGDLEWTGLAEDNAVVEPLNRRGPKSLPLLPGEWNRVTVALARDTLSLTLNDTQIYSRKMETEDDQTFGFYHDASRSAARVRKVVMRGDWPEQVPPDQLNNLAASSSHDRSKTGRRVLGAIFDDRHVFGSVLDICHRAQAMPADQRHKFLTDWVLPTDEHPTLRMALDFTPKDPAPPIAMHDSLIAEHLRKAKELGATRVMTGGNLVAPALDLVAVAKELGRLEELRRQVDPIVPTNDEQQRAKLCMLTLIDIARDDFIAANRQLEQLAELVYTGKHTSFLDRCPETLAIARAVEFPETRDAAREMVLHIRTTQVRKWLPSGSNAWSQHMRALANELHYLASSKDSFSARRGASLERFNSQPPLTDWVPASRDTSESRGLGLPQPRWEMSAPATIENVASYVDDFLFYRVPLRGDYEVECDVTSFNWRESQLWVAGKWVGALNSLQEFDMGNWHERQVLALAAKIHRADDWLRYRAVVRNGVCTIYFNGREIHQRPLTDDHDPWLAIRSPYFTNGAVRNLRINGAPQIPAEVKLAANSELAGWLPYFGNQMGPGRQWQPLSGIGGGIRGIRARSLPESHWQALLRYHRPMVEDGTLEYDFYYLEGEMHVHPALDRLAFMLQPDGVRVHWITDEQYDRTELAPDNLFDEPANRRGAEAIPLKANQWNRLQLSLAGDIVSLRLNDEVVFERKLEPTNQRTFGLFHYADRTDALVRNVVWRGDWPRELPAVAAQELAGEGTEFLDESLRDLAEVFHHDFAKDGFPLNEFRRVAGEASHFDAQPDGLHVTRPGMWGHNYSTIAPNLGVQGDFDIVASFERFEPQPARSGCVSAIFLHVLLDNDRSNECFVYRKHQWYLAEPRPVVFGAYGTRETGDIRLERFPYTTVEATSGRLRLARRGDTVYYLFAEHDSPVFRLFGTQKTTADDLLRVGLTTETYYERLTKVVWKSLTVRAHKLTGPEKSPVFKALANQLTGEVPSTALNFDGRTQHVTIPSIRYDGSHPITLEAFVTPDELRNSIMGDTQSAGIALNIARQTYTIIASHGANYGRAKADSSASRLLRVHVAGTFDGKTLQVFVNGTLEKTGRLTGTFKPSGFPMTLGASPSALEPGIDQPFDGLIDLARISHTIRYLEDFDVPTTLEADADTLALFQFDESQGQTLTDSSGNKNHGEIRGAQWVTGAGIRERAALGLAEFGRLAVPVLTEALHHADAEVKLAAIAALVAIGRDASSAIPALKQLTDHADDRVRSRAALAIPLIEAKGAR